MLRMMWKQSCPWFPWTWPLPQPRIPVNGRISLEIRNQPSSPHTTIFFCLLLFCNLFLYIFSISSFALQGWLPGTMLSMQAFTWTPSASIPSIPNILHLTQLSGLVNGWKVNFSVNSKRVFKVRTQALLYGAHVFWVPKPVYSDGFTGNTIRITL